MSNHTKARYKRAFVWLVRNPNFTRLKVWNHNNTVVVCTPNEGKMQVIPPSQTDSPQKFGLLSGRRWRGNDHLFVVGQNEATGRFFLLDHRELYKLSDEMEWPLLRLHSPEVRAKRICDAADVKWAQSTVYDHHSSTSTPHRRAHYHLVTAISFLSPDHSSSLLRRLRYEEFDDRSDIPDEMIPRVLRVPFARALNLLMSRTKAA